MSDRLVAVVERREPENATGVDCLFLIFLIMAHVGD